jgi:hypothetical protein
MYYFQKYYELNDLNETDQFGQNVMHIAASLGYQELIRYILDHGNVNLYAQDCNGNTCLHLTANQGLARLCWLITQKNGGECVRLISVLNKQNQTAFDSIKNENTPNFKKIRNWLRLEAKTNEFLLDTRNNIDKKTDKSSPSLLKIKPGTIFFRWNSVRKMQLEWLAHFLTFPISLLLPMLIYRILFDSTKFSMLHGFIGYSSFVIIIYGMTHQRHRIEHLSGLHNPFNLGLFSCLFLCNYSTYYILMIECKFKLQIRKKKMKNKDNYYDFLLFYLCILL